MTIEELEVLIADVEWERFQEPNDGNFHVWLKPNLIKFSYRVGLHFKRPMEAIMAKGEFVRMRAAPQYSQFDLIRLDPENVDKCLYTYFQVGIDAYTKSWQPKVSKDWLAQQQSQLMQQTQNSLQLAQARQAINQSLYGLGSISNPSALASGGGGGNGDALVTYGTTSDNSSLFTRLWSKW
jgi:hypothetical protein